jgi:hypothetical protein
VVNRALALHGYNRAVCQSYAIEDPCATGKERQV